jgi:hypothetical protein
VVNKSNYQSKPRLWSLIHVTNVWKKWRFYRLDLTPPTGNTRNKPRSLIADPISQPNLDTSPTWTPITEEKSEHYNFTQFRLYGKIPFLCWYYAGEFIYLFYMLGGPLSYSQNFMYMYVYLPIFVLTVIWKVDKLCPIIDFIAYILPFLEFDSTVWVSILVWLDWPLHYTWTYI